jgi:predicted DNA-binding protein
MSPENALRALAETDWTGAEVDRAPKPVSVVHSVRLPHDLSVRLEAEAHQRGVTPSALIRDLVQSGLMAVDDDTTITVRVADLRRAFDTVVHRAA